MLPMALASARKSCGGGGASAPSVRIFSLPFFPRGREVLSYSLPMCHTLLTINTTAWRPLDVRLVIPESFITPRERRALQRAHTEGMPSPVVTAISSRVTPTRPAFLMANKTIPSCSPICPCMDVAALRLVAVPLCGANRIDGSPVSCGRRTGPVSKRVIVAPPEKTRQPMPTDSQPTILCR